MSDPRRPVSRPRVLLGACAAFAVLAAIVVTAHLLQPPVTQSAGAGFRAVASDPREPLSCEETQPREGRERDAGPSQQERNEQQTGDGDVSRLSPPVVSSGQLLDCPQVWDGVTVRFVGEAVGAVLERQDGAWVQLNDDAYMPGTAPGPLPGHREFLGLNSGVGVFVPPDLAERITWLAGPDAQGDTVEVTGTFHRVDPRTAEVAIIRADTGTIQRGGGVLTEPLQPARRTVALIVAVIALAVTLAERLVARRR